MEEKEIIQLGDTNFIIEKESEGLFVGRRENQTGVLLTKSGEINSAPAGTDADIKWNLESGVIATKTIK